MKVLHVVPTYTPAFRHGGPIISVHNLNKKLVELGVDVTVYTTDINGKERLNVPLHKEVLVDGVKVFYFPSHGLFKAWSYSPSLYQKIKNTAKDFDLIHVTSVFLAASTLGAYYAKKNHKPFIISPRGSLMKEPISLRHSFIKKIYISLIEKRALKSADLVHFTSEKEKEEYLEQKYLCRNAKVIPNSLIIKESKERHEEKETEWRSKKGIPLSSDVILFLGRLVAKKGFDTLIPAFAEARKENPQIHLVIAGNDEEGYKKKIDELIAKYNLENNVTYVGFLLGEEKKTAIQTSRAFVLPSYSENFGMAVAEAMYFGNTSSGTAVIVSENVAIAEEIAAAGGAGIVINKNTQELKEAINKVIKDKKATELMAKKAGELVEEEFSPEKNGKIWLETYHDTIAKYKKLM